MGGNLRLELYAGVMVDWVEFRNGLTETRRYLLSHHEPDEHYRCYSVGLFEQKLRLCARCTGIYPGIAVGLISYSLSLPYSSSVILITILPLPALVDWYLTSFTSSRGYNIVRTITGGLLGCGYGLGLGLFFDKMDLIVLFIGIGYVVISFLLIRINDGGKHRKKYQ